MAGPGKSGPPALYPNRVTTRVDDATYAELQRLAGEEMVNVATVARKLIAEALRTREGTRKH